ncbi:MAG: hypothetical protein M1834_009236 [Cirrosporium novae-zelandiae]|nr:MAG: hypothetical protein M1834_009236 [Cirrosporium novae-zelandiae]
MFYSHEVLTSRKYGVATIWLVATLGSKSSLRKVNRKDIINVDVPKACETIITPKAPMALRLQSNLLFGVSRVYSQQCGYVLADAQAAQNNMRALLKVIKNTGLDPEAGKARPDQLVLPDDPTILADMLVGLDIDLDALGMITSPQPRQLQDFSTPQLGSTQSSQMATGGSNVGLIVPSSESGPADAGGFELPIFEASSAHQETVVPDAIFSGNEDILHDPGFEFGIDGEFLEHTVQGVPGTIVSDIPGPSDILNNSAVRQEREEGIQDILHDIGEPMQFDEPPNLGDNFDLAPEADHFFLQTNNQTRDILDKSSNLKEAETSETAKAPAKKHRARKVMGADTQTELSNADLVRWNNEYLGNMAKATDHQQQNKVHRQANKNAEFWVLGIGINGIGYGLGADSHRTALDMYIGENLLQALTDHKRTNMKRKGSLIEESNDSTRRVRPREDDTAQTGRKEKMLSEGNDFLPLIEDNSMEIGRDAPQALEDRSSQMPWNPTASIHGSRANSSARSHPFIGSIGGFPSSSGGASIIEGGLLGYFKRRSSRHPSASPLLGRGRASELKGLSALELPGYDEEGFLEGIEMPEDLQAQTDFELYGPAANVDTQTAADSQWMRETLDRESVNFLEFVQTAVEKKIAERDGTDQTNLDVQRETVTFEELLSPSQNSSVVATQAFHHVLSLATKNRLSVKQDDVHYGDIFLGLVSMP